MQIEPPRVEGTKFSPIVVFVALTAISASDVIPLSHARANFSELAEDVRGGAEKLITKNGEAYIAIIDAKRLDYYHQLGAVENHRELITPAAR